MREGRNMKVYLETKDLSVGYGRSTIIRHIDIQVVKGEVITLIGPNGAGKSTILKTISGQLKKQSGEVFVESEAIHQISSMALAKKSPLYPPKRFIRI